MNNLGLLLAASLVPALAGPLAAAGARDVPRLKAELSALESRNDILLMELQVRARLASQYMAAAGAFRQTAAEAERLANNKKTVMAMKFGLGAAGDINPATSLSQFLAGKFGDLVAGKLFSADIPYDRPSPNVPPAAKLNFAKAEQRAREKASQAASEEAATGAFQREIDEGSDVHTYLLLRGFQDGLLEQVPILDAAFQAARADYEKKKAERDQVLREIERKKNELEGLQADLRSAEQEESDRRERLANEDAAAVRKQLSTIATPGTPVPPSSIDLSPELTAVGDAMQQVSRGDAPADHYDRVREAAVRRAASKWEVPLLAPEGTKDPKAWEAQTRRRLAEGFDKKIALYDKTLDDAAAAQLKAHHRLREEVFKADPDKILEAERSELDAQVPTDCIGVPSRDSYEDYQQIHHSERDFLAWKLSEYRKMKPKADEARRRALNRDSIYNLRRKFLHKAFNETLQEYRQSQSKWASLFPRAGWQRSEEPGFEFRPETDINAPISSSFPCLSVRYEMDLAEAEADEALSQRRLDTLNEAVAALGALQEDLKVLRRNYQAVAVEARTEGLKEALEDFVHGGPTYKGLSTLQIRGRLDSIENTLRQARLQKPYYAEARGLRSRARYQSARLEGTPEAGEFGPVESGAKALMEEIARNVSIEKTGEDTVYEDATEKHLLEAWGKVGGKERIQLSAGGGPEAAVREALAALAEAYRSKSRAAFMRLVSDSYAGDLGALEDALLKDFRLYREVAISLIPDAVQAQGDEAAVDFHYDLTLVDDSGRVRKFSGRSQFVFKTEEATPRLYRMSAPMLFGNSLPASENPAAASQGTPPQETGTAPGGGTQTGSGELSAGSQGFRFASGSAVPEASADIHQFGIELEANPGGAVLSLGAGSLGSVSCLPDEIKTRTVRFAPASVGELFAIRTPDGKYAEIRITSLSAGSTLGFDYKYQANGTTCF